MILSKPLLLIKDIHTQTKFLELHGVLRLNDILSQVAKTLMYVSLIQLQIFQTQLGFFLGTIKEFTMFYLTQIYQIFL